MKETIVLVTLIFLTLFSPAQTGNMVDIKQNNKAKRDSLRRNNKLLVGLDLCRSMSLWHFRKYAYDSYGSIAQVHPNAGFAGGFSLSYCARNVGFQTGLVACMQLQALSGIRFRIPNTPVAPPELNGRRSGFKILRSQFW